MRRKTRIYYIVLDRDYNRAHHPELIGNIFLVAPPYCIVKVIKPSDGAIIFDNATDLRKFTYKSGELIPNF